MKLEMPGSVRVGPSPYAVVRPPSKDLPNANGMTDHDRLQISVRRKLRRAKAREILLHEVLHCACYPTDYANEERIVTHMAPTLLQILRDNPELVAFLLAE